MAQKYLVNFKKGTLAQYESITPNPYTFYFITDVQKIYLGSVQLSNVQLYNQIDIINEKLRNVSRTVAKTTAEWNTTPGLVAESNVIYVYTDKRSKIDDRGNTIYVPGIKIGDGSSYLIDLPFIDDIYFDHINNTDIHVTSAEKQFWNNKVRASEILTDQQTLVFTIY